jgi:fatty acid desaturase
MSISPIKNIKNLESSVSDTSCGSLCATHNRQKKKIAQLVSYPLTAYLVRTGFLIGLFFILSYLSYFFKNHPLILFSTVVIRGFLLSCLLVVVHDCAHQTFSKSLMLCRIVGVLLATPLLVNFSLYKVLHKDHHLYANTLRDTQRPRQFNNRWHFLLSTTHLKFPLRMFQLSALSLCNNHYKQGISLRHKTAIKIDSIVLLSFMGIVLFTSIINFKYIILYYVLPIFFYLVCVFLVTTAEHTGCANSKVVEANTRSIKSNCVLRYFMFNFNYHAEHHAYPFIPSPNLRQIRMMQIVNSQYSEESYIKFYLTLLKEL